MPFEAVVTQKEMEMLGQLTSCQVADAIETFDIRLRNEGIMDSSIRCLFPHLPSMVGYAVTARIRTSAPPMSGRSYPDRTDWWNYLLTIPAPRVVVLEDLDRPPGFGSCAGEVHSHIFRAHHQWSGAGLATRRVAGILILLPECGGVARLLSHARFRRSGGSRRPESASRRSSPWRPAWGDLHSTFHRQRHPCGGSQNRRARTPGARGSSFREPHFAEPP
jgi:hypothetical protein